MKEQEINVDELAGAIQEAYECIMPIKEIARGLVNDQFKNRDICYRLALSGLWGT